MKEVCKNCKHWFRNVYPNAELDEFEECEHPDMNESESGFIRAGGCDGYGDYFKTSAKFGCVLFEQIE